MILGNAFEGVDFREKAKECVCSWGVLFRYFVCFTLCGCRSK